MTFAVLSSDLSILAPGRQNLCSKILRHIPAASYGQCLKSDGLNMWYSWMEHVCSCEVSPGFVGPWQEELILYPLRAGVTPQCENIIDTTILFLSQWLGIAHYNMILAQRGFEFLVTFFFFCCFPMIADYLLIFWLCLWFNKTLKK